MSTLYNLNNDGNSLQVSKLKNVPAGDFFIGKGRNPVLIKNITDDNITIETRLYNDTDFVTTVFYPGWNPELVAELKNVTANTLQYGN